MHNRGQCARHSGTVPVSPAVRKLGAKNIVPRPQTNDPALAFKKILSLRLIIRRIWLDSTPKRDCSEGASVLLTPSTSAIHDSSRDFFRDCAADVLSLLQRRL